MHQVYYLIGLLSVNIIYYMSLTHEAATAI